MSLFEKRLLEFIVSIVFVAVIIAMLHGLTVLLAMIHPLVPFIIGLILFAAIMLFYIGYFINWLLIEPFRKGKTK